MAKKQKTGRKRLPEAEKTVLVGFYTKKRIINHFGGMAKVREKCKRELEDMYTFLKEVPQQPEKA